MTSKYSNIQIFSIPDAMLYSVEHPELPEQYVRIEDFERLRGALKLIAEDELRPEWIDETEEACYWRVVNIARECLSFET